MSESPTNAEKIQALWDAFERDGFGAATELIERTFDTDVEFNPLAAGNAGGRTYRGQDGMYAFFGELREGFADVDFEPAQCHPVGDHHVVAFTRMAGLAKGTGLPLRQDLAIVYEFSGGRVRCVTAYDKPADALEAAERGMAGA